jgi:hypothetical protein
MNNKSASLLKIVWVDYWAFLSVMAAILAVGFYVYNAFLASSPMPGADLFVLAAVALGLLGLAWRYIAIASLINSGLEVKATVSDIGFFRDRGFIKYIYLHEGNKLVGHTSVMKNKMTTRFVVGQEVLIVVDRENSRKTLLVDLFV